MAVGFLTALWHDLKPYWTLDLAGLRVTYVASEVLQQRNASVPLGETEGLVNALGGVVAR